MHILAISGSLRAASVNTALLRASAQLAPTDVAVTLYTGLDDLPHFSPERDVDAAPGSVAELRMQLQAAEAVLICTPEYAHGIPGVLKNMLDWVVASGEFIDKPVGVISAATGGEYAHASLTETLRVMSAHVIEEASLIVSFVRTKVDSEGHVTDPQTALSLQTVVSALVRATRRYTEPC